MGVTLIINGHTVDSSGDAPAPALGELSVNWGVSRQGEQPAPSTLSFTIVCKRSISDAPWLVDGAPVCLSSTDGGITRRVFTGRVRRQQATLDTWGRLHVAVTCADYLADFSNLYTSISVGIAFANQRSTQLAEHFLANGVSYGQYTPVSSPNTVRSAQSLPSIKLSSLLERFLSPGHYTYLDITDRDVPLYTAEIGVIPRAPRTMAGAAKLYTRPNGEWYAAYKAAPANLGYYYLGLDASELLADVAWTMDTQNLTTAVGVSAPRLSAETGFHSMEDGPEITAGAAAIKKYGIRRQSIETDLVPDYNDPGAGVTPAITQQMIRDAWMDTAPAWEPNAVTLRDTAAAPDNWSYLLALRLRYLTWVEIWAIHENRPTSGPSIVNAPVIGGRMDYDGRKWKVSFSLGKPAAPAPVATAQQYRAMDLQASTNPAIWGGTLGSIGDSLTFEDFNYISKV